MIPRFLSLIGLMRRSDHEAKVRTLEADRDRLDDKFKKAVTDLERVVSRNQKLMFEKGLLAAANSSLRSEINDLRPDAEAMRAKRARDRDQKAARRKERVQP